MKHSNIFLKRMILCFLLLSLLCSFSACKTKQNSTKKTINKTIQYYPENYLELDLPEYRLDIVRTHHTVECADCLIIHEATLDVLNKEYPDELKKGLITYRAIDCEYLENKPLVLKYDAMEEDFITHIVGNGLNIMEKHHDLWLLTNNKTKLRSRIATIIESCMNKLYPYINKKSGG